MYVIYESRIFLANNLKLNLLARESFCAGCQDAAGRARGFRFTSPAIIEYDLRAKLDSSRLVIKMQMVMMELRWELVLRQRKLVKRLRRR